MGIARHAGRRALWVCVSLSVAACGSKPSTVPAPPAAAAPAAVEGPAIARELALATFDSAWSRIANTHYDTTFRGVDWAGVRDELRPRAASSRTVDALRDVVREMLGRLGESHYALIPGEVSPPSEQRASAENDGDVGVELRLADGEVVVARVDPGGPAAAAGVGPGWVVEAIDDRNLGERLTRLRALEGSGEYRLALTQFLWFANGVLEGPPGSTVRVVARDRQDQTRELALGRRTRPGQPVRLGNLPTMVADLSHRRVTVGEQCVGVIQFNIWMAPIASAFDRAIDELRDCAGIVIDLRGNPGGVAGMVMGVAGHFLTERTPLGLLKSRSGELRLVANPRTVNSSGERVAPFARPLALLVDPLSVSTSEIFAAGMQAAGRARVFGQTSAGQALPAMAVRLPNEDVLMHVIADMTVPNGGRVEGVGVKPDVPVPLKRVDLLEGRDAVLQAAVEWILAAPASTRDRIPELNSREEPHR